MDDRTLCLVWNKISPPTKSSMDIYAYNKRPDLLGTEHNDYFIKVLSQTLGLGARNIVVEIDHRRGDFVLDWFYHSLFTRAAPEANIFIISNNIVEMREYLKSFEMVIHELS